MNKELITEKLNSLQYIIGNYNEELNSLKNRIETVDDKLSDLTLEESQLELQLAKIEEEEQLIDEIKNPEDYANFDLKDLESSQ